MSIGEVKGQVLASADTAESTSATFEQAAGQLDEAIAQLAGATADASSSQPEEVMGVWEQAKSELESLRGTVAAGVDNARSYAESL